MTIIRAIVYAVATAAGLLFFGMQWLIFVTINALAMGRAYGRLVWRRLRGGR